MTLDVLYPLIRGTIDERLFRTVKRREFLLGAVPNFSEYSLTDEEPPPLPDRLGAELSDDLTNIEDTLRALDDLVRQGKVRYIGCSNLWAWQVMKALAVSDANGLERFRCTQSYYSLAGREIERDLIPLIEDQGLGLLAWSPLAGGFLSGKFKRDEKGEGRRESFDFPPVDEERSYDTIEAMQKIADTRNASIAQIALAWLLAKDAVTSVIIGVRNLKQLDDDLGAVELELSELELAALDEVSRIPPAYPGWMDVLGSDRRPDELRRLERATDTSED